MSLFSRHRRNEINQTESPNQNVLCCSCYQKGTLGRGTRQRQPLLSLPLIRPRFPSSSPAVTPARLGDTGDRVPVLPTSCKVLQLCSELTVEVFHVVGQLCCISTIVFPSSFPIPHFTSPHFISFLPLFLIKNA